ncbi:MAG: hypothetical protein MI747_13140, partial [Desulfobacterales bacterium]|nr:hypothetical protein [Desulfobacterales bacterium]
MYDPPRIKSRFHYFHLANAILMGNLIAGLAGDHMGTTFFEHRYLVNEPGVPMLKYVYNYITYVAVIFSIAFIRWYEQPIRKCLWGYYRNTPPSPALLARARKRVLNEPYVITFMEALLWMGATLLLWFMGAQSGLGIGIACGLITVVLAFFWMEYINQNHLIPLFFPDNK